MSYAVDSQYQATLCENFNVKINDIIRYHSVPKYLRVTFRQEHGTTHISTRRQN